MVGSLRGRGISVCDRWSDFEAFRLDMGLPPKGASLDRINNNGNYEPSNCRWATPLQQRQNQSDCKYLTFEGRTMLVRDWARYLQMSPQTIHNRINRGWGVAEALTTPPHVGHSVAGRRGNRVRWEGESNGV